MTENKKHCKKVHLFTVFFCVYRAKNRASKPVFSTIFHIISRFFQTVNSSKGILRLLYLGVPFYKVAGGGKRFVW